MTVATTKDKVQRILTDFLGRVELDRDGGFTFEYESTRVFVGIAEIGEDSAAIQVWAPVLFDVKFSNDLFRWVALNTDNYRFGHIGLVENSSTPGTGMIVFSHNLLGDYLDPEELRWALMAVASTADSLDDEARKMFGGARYADT